MPIAGVLLAAGASSRMGSPKGLLDWRGMPLVRAHALAWPASIDLVVAITGRPEPWIEALDGVDARIIDVGRTASMSDSLRIALPAGASRVLVAPIDTVPQSNVAALLSECHRATVPTSNTGQYGHPVLLGHDAIARLLSGEDLRAALDGADIVGTHSASCHLDFDDPASFERVRRAFEGEGWSG